MRLVLAAMLLLLTTLGQAQGLSVPDGGGFGTGPAEVEFLEPAS